jgi:two-component system, NarL family, nitrate/nitrite response regulator NarL
MMTFSGPGYGRDRAEVRRRRCLRVLVVDDHDLFRTGLRTLLEQEGYKVVDAPSAEDALAVARAFRPEVVIQDVNLAGASGIDAASMLLVEHPDAAVLMLTVVADHDQVMDAIRAGASGYLLKDAEMPEIVAGIEAAAAGHASISPRVATGVLTSVRAGDPAAAAATPAEALSGRERAVLALLVDGYPNAEIARRLHLSPSTVKNHVARVFEKLGVASRVEAATFAVRHELLDAEPRTALAA